MRTLLIILALMLTVVLPLFSQSNNVDTIVTTKTYWSGTLTSTIDTVTVSFSDPEKFEHYTITASSSAADTLTVWTKTRDDLVWVQLALIEISSGSNVSNIAASTTTKKYAVIDVQPYSIRVISTSDDASTSTIKVAGESGDLVIGSAVGGSAVVISSGSVTVTPSDTIDMSHTWTVTSASAVIGVGSTSSDTLTVPAKSVIIGLVVPASLSDSVYMDVSYTTRSTLYGLYSSAGAKQYFIADTSTVRTFYISESTSIGMIRYVSFRSTDAAWKTSTLTVIYKRD